MMKIVDNYNNAYIYDNDNSNDIPNNILIVSESIVNDKKLLNVLNANFKLKGNLYIRYIISKINSSDLI